MTLMTEKAPKVYPFRMDRLETFLGPVQEGRETYFQENPQEWARQQIAVLANRFPVTVDYHQPLEAMIRVGKYDVINDDITEEHFPIRRVTHEYDFGDKTVVEKPFSRNDRVLVDVELCLMSWKDLSLPSLCGIKEVLEAIKRKGLRSAVLPELLAFGTAFPEVQRMCWISALGSSWRDDGVNLVVPCLYVSDDGRHLDLRWFLNLWRDNDRFLCAR